MGLCMSSEDDSSMATSHTTDAARVNSSEGPATTITQVEERLRRHFEAVERRRASSSSSTARYITHTVQDTTFLQQSRSTLQANRVHYAATTPVNPSNITGDIGDGRSPSLDSSQRRTMWAGRTPRNPLVIPLTTHDEQRNPSGTASNDFFIPQEQQVENAITTICLNPTSPVGRRLPNFSPASSATGEGSDSLSSRKRRFAVPEEQAWSSTLSMRTARTPIGFHVVVPGTPRNVVPSPCPLQDESVEFPRSPILCHLPYDPTCQHLEHIPRQALSSPTSSSASSSSFSRRSSKVSFSNSVLYFADLPAVPNNSMASVYGSSVNQEGAVNEVGLHGPNNDASNAILHEQPRGGPTSPSARQHPNFTAHELLLAVFKVWIDQHDNEASSDYTSDSDDADDDPPLEMVAVVSDRPTTRASARDTSAASGSDPRLSYQYTNDMFESTTTIKSVTSLQRLTLCRPNTRSGSSQSPPMTSFRCDLLKSDAAARCNYSLEATLEGKDQEAHSTIAATGSRCFLNNSTSCLVGDDVTNNGDDDARNAQVPVLIKAEPPLSLGYEVVQSPAPHLMRNPSDAPAVDLSRPPADNHAFETSTLESDLAGSWSYHAQKAVRRRKR